MTKPNVSDSQITHNLTTNWGEGDARTRTWQLDTIRFALPDTSPSASNDENDGFQVMTANEKAFARNAFQLWDDLIAKNIDETTGSSREIDFAYSSTTEDDGTYAYVHTASHTTSDLRITRGEVWIDANWDSNRSSEIDFGSFGFQTYLHEIGHALGLSHPGNYDATDDEAPTYDDDATYSRDTQQYTVMSYFEAGEDGSGAAYGRSTRSIMKFAATPMVDDILAIQAKYGADMTTRTGNTTYGFNSNADREVYNFDRNHAPIYTIWDAGGLDSIDTRFFDARQNIDLRAGHYSDIGGMRQNIAIAYNVTIEDAIGGTWDDTITGNDAGNHLSGGLGRDTLYGLGGFDKLDGGLDNDTLDGGTGADNMAGSTGDDTYYVDTVGRPIVTKGDHVTGRGSRGDLTFFPSDRVVEGANQGTDKVIASVSYGLGANVENLELAGKNAIVGVGNGLDNQITGNGLANTLIGNDGNDVLDGKGGSDSMTGGLGDDTYYVDAKASRFVGRDIHFGPGRGDVGPTPGDQVIEAADGGHDHVYSSVSYTLGANVEALSLTGTSTLSGLGNDLDNEIDGNDAANILNGGAGDDQLFGNGGSDSLIGGLGNDYLDGVSGGDNMVGGLGDDIYKIDMADHWLRTRGGGTLVPGDKVFENAGEGTDTVFTNISYTLGDNVENLTLDSLANISGFGNSQDNIITGSQFDNVLDGKGGSDQLIGGDGQDTFQFTSALDGVNVANIVDFSVADDTIRLSSDIFLGLGTGVLSVEEFVIGKHAVNGDDHVIYDDESGELKFDENGSAEGGEVTFAILAKNLQLTNQDFLIA